MKIHERNARHMTKMAAMPVYGKNPTNFFFILNQWTEFHETWYVASKETPAKHTLFK